VAASARAELFLSKPTVLQNPGGPLKIATLDISSDGIPDLVVANSTGNSISVHLGVGGGQFGSRVDYQVGANPIDLVERDVNNDGRLDLVVVNSGSSNVSVLTGNADGTFNAATNFPVGSNPTSFDVTGRGFQNITEIVTVNTGAGSILLPAERWCRRIYQRGQLCRRERADQGHSCGPRP
jgi:N-acetylglutamate synthase/N-acetylornithine aminotransferase